MLNAVELCLAHYGSPEEEVICVPVTDLVCGPGQHPNSKVNDKA